MIVRAMPACDRPRLLIAEADQPTRERLARELLGHGIDVVAECPDGLSTIEAATQTTPDVCLLDVQIPCTSASETAARIRQRLPGMGIVVMTASPNESDLEQAIQAGAHGYVDKDLDTPRLASALRAVCSGETAFPRALLARVLRLQLAY